MPQKETLPNEPYDFAVEAVFHMSDGSVFFVGLPDKLSVKVIRKPANRIKRGS